MINIIISVKGLQKISDKLYIRVCIAKFITTLYITKFIITNDWYNRYQISNRYQINGEVHVNYPSLLNLVSYFWKKASSTVSHSSNLSEFDISIIHCLLILILIHIVQEHMCSIYIFPVTSILLSTISVIL